MIGWAESSLNDRHETVRAEAAWFLSGNSAISPKRVAELFVDASDVTQIGLAAVAGRIDKDRVAALSKAIRNESTLTKAAFDWAAS